MTSSSAAMMVLRTSGVGEDHVEVSGSQVEGETVCGPQGLTAISLSMPPCHDTVQIINRKSHL